MLYFISEYEIPISMTDLIPALDRRTEVGLGASRQVGDLASSESSQSADFNDAASSVTSQSVDFNDAASSCSSRSADEGIYIFAGFKEMSTNGSHI